MAQVAYETVHVPGALLHLYQEMAISPVNLLKNYALTQIYPQIQKYETEKRYFEGKYGCQFQEFQAKVAQMEQAENFEWEEDLMDWEFAIENFYLWQVHAEIGQDA